MRSRHTCTLDVGVVFSKCLYNYTYPKTVFYCSQILSVTSRFTSIAYVSCKCSPECVTQVLCTYGFIHQAADTIADQLQSCRPEILYSNLSTMPSQNRNPEKYTDRMHERDRQTDRRTDGHLTTAKIALTHSVAR